jgi:IS5 family transposase
MARKALKLRKVPKSQVEMFKIKNRKGFAAVCKNNLTEGRTTAQAITRMDKALKRIGLTIG